MLTSQLKKIIEIDEKINSIHQELSDLYQERADITDRKPTAQTSPNIQHMSKTRWGQAQYQRLTSIWKQYDITVPSKQSLEARLHRAYDLILELSDAQPELVGDLSVMLVPPHKDLPFPVPTEIRNKQAQDQEQDYVHPELPKEKKSKGWRLLIVHTGADGLYLGNTATILSNKQYMVGKRDMRALGAREYAALTLQEQGIDTNSWTLLLRDTQPADHHTPIASNTDGRYRFDITDTNSIFSDDRFRPAIEA